jgi:DNA-binding XRE family transcriptional regulator
MSHADLAETVGVSRRTFSAIEMGRFTPSLVTVSQVALLQGIGEGELLAEWLIWLPR